MKKQFLRLAMIEQKTYDEISKELGVEKRKLSEWWDETKEERERIEWIRNLYNRKKITAVTFSEFYNWYSKKEKKCCYCGIKEGEIAELISRKGVRTKRLDTRGRNLELERKDPNNRYDDLNNLELSCYWCNNAKTDEFTSDEFKPMGREIGKIMKKRLGGVTTGATDENTNFLYLSDLLKKKHRPFYDRLIPVLERNHIDYGLLPDTKDVWVKDFMPVQIVEERYIQFRYEPDYLMKNKKYRATMSDAAGICGAIGVTAVKSDIVLDGGNLVRCGSKAILTSKIFRENPRYTETELLHTLEELLHIDNIIVIPPEPGDWLGHADGMVRFLDENTVLINDYSREKKKEHYIHLRMSLRNAGLELIEIPYNPYENQSEIDAKGVYINFLRMKDLVLVPVFGLDEDEKAVSRVRDLFRDSTVDTVRSDEIAKDGGVLNCISWNIKTR